MTMNETIYLSKRGMKDLKKEVAVLERSLKHVQQEIRELDKTDSREERFELSERLSRMEAIQAELREKQAYLSNAKQLPRKRDALKVALGSVVDLIDTSGRIVSYTLVDSIEANPSDGRISVVSPLGKSLIGMKADQTIKWGAGMKSHQLTLVRIS